MSDDFTAQDYRQLSEAIGGVLGWHIDDTSLPAKVREEHNIVIAAARRFLDRYQICQTCDGMGKVCLGDPSHTSMNPDPCPDCVGGLVPNQERLEQAAEEILVRAGKEEHTAADWAKAEKMAAAAVAVRAFDKEPT